MSRSKMMPSAIVFNPTVRLAGSLITGLAVGVLAGVGGTVALLIGGADAGPVPALTALVAVFMAWASLHLMYAARYEPVA